MKKSILAVAGVAALAGGLAVPFAGVNAADPSLSDSLSITIASNCTLAYDSTNPHTYGGTEASKTGTWSENTLSATIKNSSADTNIGSTKMNIICNDAKGYDLKLTTAGALTGATATNTIPYITAASAPTSTTSEWGVYNGSAWVLLNGKVATSSSATAGTDVTVNYGVSASSTQAADTYTATATYTLSHPAV